ncbi:MAG TPA: transporter substrate-binding domain-containing protein [Candidatus Pseudogracilibacillus intestinigallinarum]|uniref:Transporter substrate-binding domain-containing protein n=1 Tax=Candidatus Pseudogracilibacillus intestinigallinarum TaxID=2838742 RepID=A0A9D1TK95_9BACI|nr:transporter substrate-binding domain-containing protein [Candidatus Pseudogracilibacillus intestinigallinarum]
MKKHIVQIMLIIVVGMVIAGCASTDASKDGVRKVKVAYVQNSKPMTYTDDKGEPNGYDVKVLQEVEKRMPQYEFEFIGTSDDDLLLGVEQGKYQVGVKNAFYTEERTKKFIYPEQFIGLSSIGLLLKKEDEDITSLEDFAKAGYSLAPIAANNAQYTVIEQYNEENPNNKIDLKAGDTFTVDVIQWVNEGRVDGGVIIEGMAEKQVFDEDGPYYNLRDEVVYNEFDVIETWPLFNKQEQQFADDFDKAMKEVRDEKITNELSTEFYGRDLFELLQEE